MRTLALMSGGVFLFAAAQQPNLPAPLKRNFDTLAAAPSLTATYKVQTIGEAAETYKLVLSRPTAFRLTSPTGYVVGDGKTVTTYVKAKNSYTQVPYTDAWATEFARRPEVVAWGAYLSKSPATDIVAAKAGASRKIGGADTTEVDVSAKKIESYTLYLDKKLGVARGALVKTGEKQILVTASDVQIGKETVAPTEFAFTAPEGSTKEEPAGTYLTVKALIDERCMPCHGGANPRAGIALNTYEGIMATVVPGDPAGSLLVKSVKGDGVRKMPLGNHPALNASEIKMLESWIANGAKQ